MPTWLLIRLDPATQNRIAAFALGIARSICHDACMMKAFALTLFLAVGFFRGAFAADSTVLGEFISIPHLGDQWPADKNAPGFVSVLDRDNRVISNIGGTPPVYDAAGVLQPMRSTGAPFVHPHGVAIDGEGNLYVAQFSSPAAPLLKFERIK
jgi:hypothetical protein